MKQSLFDGIPESASEELLSDLLSTESLRIERIVSFGQSSPDRFWYEQDENEWVLLLEGSATLEFDDGTLMDLEPGDYVDIPAGCRHRVARTARNERTVWLAVFYR